MGWGKFLGDFAKDYISERGTKGTMEDIGDLVGGIAGLFGGNDDEEQTVEWSDLVDAVDDLIKLKKFEEALNLVNTYYEKYENDEIDVYYHDLIATILIECMDENCGVDEEEYNAAKQMLDEQIKEARKYNDKDVNKGLAEIVERAKKIDCTHTYIVDVSDTESRINRLCDLGEFDPAFGVVMDFCDKHENSVYSDYFVAVILIKQYQSELNNKRVPVDSNLDVIKSQIKTVASYEDSGDLCETLNSMYNDLQARVTAMTPSVESECEATKANNASQTCNDSETEYMDEFKAVLADGVVSDRERRLLDRLAKSLGISPERAFELEKQCQPSPLTPDEEEYAAEVTQCLADDGEITDRERRLLDRLAKSLGITPERAKEIESGIK